MKNWKCVGIDTFNRFNPYIVDIFQSFIRAIYLYLGYWKSFVFEKDLLTFIRVKCKILSWSTSIV